jgi:recombination protein RecT
MSGQLQAKSPQQQLRHYFASNKGQLSAALPKHLNPDRMSRLAMTAFNQNPALQKCDPKSIFSSIIVLSQLGLEPGIDGQGYLVPYGKTCTAVPGWKGYVDLVSRAGRASVWTGAVYEGDEFEYQLGDSPFLRHLPGDENEEQYLTHVYAVGRVKDSEYPIIEVWTIKKILKHRDKHNKVGKAHYSYKNLEMYARKIPLMQVLKYMPKSVELQNAMEIDLAASEGKGADYIDGELVIVDSIHEPDATPESRPITEEGLPTYPKAKFDESYEKWKKLVEDGKKHPEGIIKTVTCRYKLTVEQKEKINSLAVKEEPPIDEEWVEVEEGFSEGGSDK